MILIMSIEGTNKISRIMIIATGIIKALRIIKRKITIKMVGVRKKNTRIIIIDSYLNNNPLSHYLINFNDLFYITF